MGRPRSRDKDLPPRMYSKTGPDGTRRYYYGRQMVALGSDLARAKRIWADYEYTTPEHTVEQLVERYLDLILPTLAANSVRMYRHGAKVAVKEWGSLPLSDLKAPHLAQFRDRLTTKPTQYNMARVVLAGAYAKAVEWGWVEHNPAAAMKGIPSLEREVYLEDGQYDAIYTVAPEWLRLAMDMAYATALRPIDVINIRWTDVTDDGITVLQQKTKKKTKVAQKFGMTEGLREMLDRARSRRIVGLYVVADERGRRILQDRYQEWWRAIRGKLGLDGVQFRDIRSKSGTDRQQETQDLSEAQRLLGHASPRMTERYMKKMMAQNVTPMRRRKA